MSTVPSTASPTGKKGLFAGIYNAIVVLIVAAVAAEFFTLAAGIILYRNTQRLTLAEQQVERSYDALSSLQQASLLTQSIELRSRLYLVTHDEDQLNRARSSANLLVTATTHLAPLVENNRNQSKNVADLTTCAEALSEMVNGLDVHPALQELQVQQCRKTISLITDQEETLLEEQRRESLHQFQTSAGTEFFIIGIRMAIILALFWLLLRDAFQRRRIATKTLATNQSLAKTVKALEDQANQSTLLTAARDEMQLCVDVAQVYASAANSFAKLLPGTNGSLCIINNSRKMVEVVSSWGKTELEDFAPPETCCGLRSGTPRWRQPGQSEIQCTHFVGAPPDRYLCHPIVAHGNTLGILYLQCDDDEIVQSVTRHTDGLRHLVQITGMAIATLNLQTELQSQSIRDSLTGLFNRRFLEVSLERELLRAARRKQILTVMMLDADFFKRFNDKHGHRAGDAALKALADIFRAHIRLDDIACRYGGEEFTIILPDVTAELACERAEGIRKAVEELAIPVGDETCSDFSISIGVAFYPSDGESAELLLKRADAALYRAKREGRNRVSLYEAALS